MAEVNIIYFDMDGVLADFDRGVKELLDLEPIDQGNHTAEQDDVMFSRMREIGHFYGKLEPIPGSIDLFMEVYSKYGDRCRILSGIPKSSRGIDTAAEDKRAWVRRYLDEDVIVNTVLRAEKPQFATGSNDYLIDDFTKNISEWESAGGTGILCRNAEEVRIKLRGMGIL